MTVTEQLQKSIRFGDHSLEFATMLNPTTMRVNYGVRCRKCGWRFVRDESFQKPDSQTAADDKTKKVLYELAQSFVKEVDLDCRTAALMAVVTAVHDR